jgi:hypothetical protein
MATTPRDRGYGRRKRQSLASRHPMHERRVYACPRCSPNARDLISREKAEDATED